MPRRYRQKSAVFFPPNGSPDNVMKSCSQEVFTNFGGRPHSLFLFSELHYAWALLVLQYLVEGDRVVLFASEVFVSFMALKFSASCFACLLDLAKLTSPKFTKSLCLFNHFCYWWGNKRVKQLCDQLCVVVTALKQCAIRLPWSVEHSLCFMKTLNGQM